MYDVCLCYVCYAQADCGYYYRPTFCYLFWTVLGISYQLIEKLSFMTQIHFIFYYIMSIICHQKTKFPNIKFDGPFYGLPLGPLGVLDKANCTLSYFRVAEGGNWVLK